MNLKIWFRFKDRVGIVADISTLIAESGGNIVSMEVIRKSDEAHIYIDIENGNRLADKGNFIDLFDNIDDLLEIGFIDTLPVEIRENRFRVVLDNISDGVISIDKEGKISTINRVAGKVLNCGEEIVGQDINNLDLPDYSILECLNGKSIHNVRHNLITKTGRYQYISTCKPIRDSSGLIIGAVKISKDMQGIKRLAGSISDPGRIDFSDIIGKNIAIQEAICFAQKIASTDASVSIRGDSGTGKELFARAIHTASGKEGPFIPVNCAALPENLLESELFGYVGGAFTGGKKEGKPGLFEIAKNGTVFLDEIAEMHPDSQAKLLRLIQEKAVRRIGESQEIPISARIITCTNKNLEHMVEKKEFRQDLYYRISVLPIHIPPLKQRLDDIEILVEHFLFQLSDKLGKKSKTLTPDALSKLHGHDWPGNVRELKNVVERASILCDSETIDAGLILFSHELNEDRQTRIGGMGANDGSLRERIADYEKTIILETLDQNISLRKAAKLLKISHTALIKKMRKYNIERITTVTSSTKSKNNR